MKQKMRWQRNGFKIFLALVMVLALVPLMAGCGGDQNETPPGTETDGDKLKVGFVYVGPVDDGGWTTAQEQARQYLVQELPDVDASDYVESLPENPADAERVI